MTLYSLCETAGNNQVIVRLVVVLMNIIAYPLIAVWTILGIWLFPFGFLLMKLVFGHSRVFITRWCIWIYGRGWQMILTPFVKFVPPEISGHHFAAPGIIVVNHRSFFDTYCINMLPVSDICLAVRAWPFKIPLYNIFMKMSGYINIEDYSWDKALTVSKQNIKNKSYILFFPEGHRSSTNQMTRFYSGAFKMAVDNNVPVIPVCITGTQDLLPPGRRYLKPAKIRMEILDPVWPDRFDGDMRHLSLQKHVKEQMNQRILQMDAQDQTDKDH